MNTSTLSDTSKSSDAAGVLLILWSIITLTICVPGNILVLVSSIKYHAIKLDKITVILIHNLAIADLGYAVFGLLPTVLSHATDADVFTGNRACAILHWIRLVVGPVSVFFVLALNISKLTCFLFPFRVRLRTKATGHKIAAFLWASFIFLISSFEVASLVRRGRLLKAEYSLDILLCVFELPVLQRRRHTVMSMIFLVLTILAVFIIFVCTIWLISSIRSVIGIQKESAATLIAVSSVLLVSMLPFLVSAFYVRVLPSFLSKFTNRGILLPKLKRFPIWIKRSMAYCHYVNFAANPIIYFLTVKSFNVFVKEKWACFRVLIAGFVGRVWSVLVMPRSAPSATIEEVTVNPILIELQSMCI